MPRYEYECGKCEKRYEFDLKFEERDNPPLCEECGNKLERLISKFSFKLNGGFTAENHYGLKKEKSAEK